MASQPVDMVPQLLMKIQEEAAAFRKGFEARFDRLETRFDRVEDLLSKQRRDIAGILVMMKATVGDFDARVTRLEDKVRVLEQPA